MDLKELLSANSQIDFVDVVSYRPLPPRYVGLVTVSGRAIYLTTDMCDLGERVEVGILKLVDPWKASGEEAEVKERFPGGRVVASEYLQAPNVDRISGVRIKLDTGDLIVTAGDAPYSIFFSFGDVQRGRPEFPIDEYKPIA
jgi:hypothetical protein